MSNIHNSDIKEIMAENKTLAEELGVLIQNIENKIDVEESKERSKVIKKRMSDLIEEVLTFINQLLIRAYDVYFGMVIQEMDPVIDFKIRGAVGSDVRSEPFKLLYNPVFIANYNFKEFLALVLSEVLKITYLHPSTFAKYNSVKDEQVQEHLEASSDASVQGMIEKEVRLSSLNDSKPLFKLPEDFTTVSDIKVRTKKNIMNDESLDYYFRILQMYDQKDGGQNPSGGGQASQSQSQQQPGIGSDGNGQGNPDGDATPQNSNGKDPHDSWNTVDSEKSERATKNMIQSVVDAMSAKNRGQMSAGMAQYIEQLLKPPEINWRQILAQFIGTIPFPSRSTTLRLNRRQPDRHDLHGRISDRKVKIVVAIDTSGSMSDKDIAYCMNEIFNISKAHNAEITIIECDARINKVYIAKKPNEICPQVNGRGGTAFTPVIEHINNNMYFRDALLVYFTDGYGELEIPKPKTLKNLWVVLEDEKCLSIKEPYGIVKCLKKDENYKKMYK